MKTINHECYVSLEVAKLLKQAGFDWECDKCYDCTNSDCTRYEEYSSPTLAVAQRWLREVKGIYIGIVTLENKRCVTNSDGWTFHYEYDKPMFDCDIQDERCKNISTLDNSFDTYEEAQETGVKKALETILEKGE